LWSGVGTAACFCLGECLLSVVWRPMYECAVGSDAGVCCGK
jgi:hypothetical protein